MVTPTLQVMSGLKELTVEARKNEGERFEALDHDESSNTYCRNG